MPPDVLGMRWRSWLLAAASLLLLNAQRVAAQEDATVVAGAAQACECTTTTEAPAAQGSPVPLYISLPIIGFLVTLSGLFSGLTLGLMGLDLIGLQAVENGDNPSLARCAKKIAPVRANGNLLLCTLLLGNVAVNSALSILMADLASGLVGFLVSTGLIVLFGEILPQAACSKYALQVGAATVGLVKVLIAAFYLITKPLSILLDTMLGKDIGVIYTSNELMELMKLQVEHGAMDEAAGQIAKQVVEGALSFRNKLVKDVMTPMEDAYMLSISTRLGYDAMRAIFESGFSRIPVFGDDRHDYRGMLNTKDLMLADPEDEMKLGDFISIFDRKAETFQPGTRLVETLDAFKKGKTHMGLVRDMNLDDTTCPRIVLCGVITLEDVVEEILQEEIVDEHDVYVDVDNHVAVNDGREERKLNLGIFNPVWRLRDEFLSREEVSAIAAHLCRNSFNKSSGMELSPMAVDWLVGVSSVQNKTRVSPVGSDVAAAQDTLYKSGFRTSRCLLVLQGRCVLKFGQDELRSEAGAFQVLAKHSLMYEDYVPDFTAFVGTPKARFLSISREHYLQARALDKEPLALQQALSDLKSTAAGEQSRMEAKEKMLATDGGNGTDYPAGSRKSTDERVEQFFGQGMRGSTSSATCDSVISGHLIGVRDSNDCHAL
eukprot:TRINITY_DN64255_c0_g1_i1.p1 TRINITY_DN64255_c0_g1~~TRINITY_DN64255_c0_g1_i1.p1  ORF type:complete len:694 (-),score=168.02 TRINITY_DN64255_c0_g1_i1:101-2077(-)